jgi:hypothetical protein
VIEAKNPKPLAEEPKALNINAIVKFIVIVPAVCLAVVISWPMLDDLDKVVHDCVDTKPANRTAAQKEHCKPSGAFMGGLIIPGLL